MSNNNRPNDGAAVLFVCTGNICRSPTAAAVLADLVKADPRGTALPVVASAGTHGYHVGEPADRRAIEVAARHGIDLTAHRARAVAADDFFAFDLMVALDRGHHNILDRMRPRDATAELRLFMEFARAPGDDVPDPYYGDLEDFELMMELIKDGARGILRHIAGR